MAVFVDTCTRAYGQTHKNGLSVYYLKSGRAEFREKKETRVIYSGVQTNIAEPHHLLIDDHRI